MPAHVLLEAGRLSSLTIFFVWRQNFLALHKIIFPLLSKAAVLALITSTTLPSLVYAGVSEFLNQPN